MSKPRLLDLFSCQGGAGMGYSRAGFEVVGVDIEPQPRYPFEFHQADALEYLMEHWHEFDAVHASPPCHDHSVLKSHSGLNDTGWLLSATREALTALPLPWVIENVPGAVMRADYRLCGCMFDLPGLRRERWFETSWHGFAMRSPCLHLDKTVTVTGHPGGSSTRDGESGFGSKAEWERAMGIDWMTADGLAQAVPPAFTTYLGEQLLESLERAA